MYEERYHNENEILLAFLYLGDLAAVRFRSHSHHPSLSNSWSQILLNLISFSRWSPVKMSVYRICVWSSFKVKSVWGFKWIQLQKMQCLCPSKGSNMLEIHWIYKPLQCSHGGWKHGFLPFLYLNIWTWTVCICISDFHKTISGRQSERKCV